MTFSAYNWVETRLPVLPYNVVTGNLDFRDSYLFSVGASKVLISDFKVPVPFTPFVLAGNDLEVEAQLAKHTGLQDNFEATVALVARTGDYSLPLGLSVNFAGGIGLSYAFQNPKYEKGPTGIRGVGSVNLQSYITFETEFSHERVSNVHFVTKLHHRSGIYGLISPQDTGSNFLGAGLRIDF